MNGNGSHASGVRIALAVICPLTVAGIIALGAHMTSNSVHETPEQKAARVRSIVHTELDQKIDRKLATLRDDWRSDILELKEEIRELRKEIRK